MMTADTHYADSFWVCWTCRCDAPVLGPCRLTIQIQIQRVGNQRCVDAFADGILQQQYYKIPVAFAVFCTCLIVKGCLCVPVYFVADSAEADMDADPKFQHPPISVGNIMLQFSQVALNTKNYPKRFQ